MPHLNVAPGDHDHTVSMYIVNIAQAEPRLLLHRHRVAKRWFQPGGHIEAQETYWQAVIHELLEETGFELSQLDVLQPFPLLPTINGQYNPVPIMVRHQRYERLDHFHDDLGYAFVTAQEPNLPLSPEESQEVDWFTLTELASIPANDVNPDMLPLARELLSDWERWARVPATDFSTLDRLPGYLSPLMN